MELKLLASWRGCKHPHVKSPACKSSLSGSLNACRNVAAVRRCRSGGSLKELMCHSACPGKGKKCDGAEEGSGWEEIFNLYMALIASVLSSAAGTAALSCDLLHTPIKSEKPDKTKQKGNDEDAHGVSQCPPPLPQQSHTPTQRHGCLGCSMWGSRVWLPALGRGEVHWPKSASLHPGFLLTHRRIAF